MDSGELSKACKAQRLLIYMRILVILGTFSQSSKGLWCHCSGQWAELLVVERRPCQDVAWSGGESGTPKNRPAAFQLPLPAFPVLLSAIKNNHPLLIFPEIENDTVLH